MLGPALFCALVWTAFDVPDGAALRTAGLPTVDSSPATQLPAGMRWVGYAHEAIAVPENWPTNAGKCGGPAQDTVLIDRGTVPACYAPRPADVESVEVLRGSPRFDHRVDLTVTIDGVQAERRSTTCRTFGPSKQTRTPAGTLCSADLYFPDDRVEFIVESSTDAAHVDELLARVHHLPDLTGVPASRVVFVREQEHSGAAYLRAVKRDGFRARVVTRRERGLRPGYVLTTTPVAGTMRPAGSRVTVTISR
jgi:hypothetical protein